MRKRIIRHIFLYPFRYSSFGFINRCLFKLVLKFQNSVPLYLVAKKSQTVIQVGTPNFRTVHRFSKLVGEHGKVIIVEADPTNANNLIKDIPKLKWNNVRIENLGAWSEPGNLVFYKSDDHKGDHKIPVDGVEMDNDHRTTYSEKVEIKVDALDNILDRLNVKAFNYLSITVNGAEYEVLKGAQASIIGSPKAIIFSKGHARTTNNGLSEPINVKISDYLQKLGCRTIISKGEKSVSQNEDWKEREGDVFAWKDSSI